MSTATVFAADSVVVFNEIMYHPAADEDRMEWIELHNQLVVPVDISAWSLSDGVDYTFPDGTVIGAEGYLVIAVSPDDLKATTGLTAVYGPYEGRLANSGERLRLQNNSGRIMDQIEYSDGGDWPAAPDGSGVSLAKIDPALAGPAPTNWTWSRQIGGTPGRENFPAPSETRRTTLIEMFDPWRYYDQGYPGMGWYTQAFSDITWSSGPAGFWVGQQPSYTQPVAIDTLFSTGVDDNGDSIAPGQDDPHYVNVATGLPLLVMQNHPAWLANDAQSRWIGFTAQGTDNQPAGQFTFRTRFDLSGYNPETAQLSFLLAVDNTLNDIRINGVSTGIAVSGFNAWNGPYQINSGFVAGLNTLDFVWTNEGPGANPSGLRVKISGTAVPMPGQTELAADKNAYYFRTTFNFASDPSYSTQLEADWMIGDGVVIYLNGYKTQSINMPAGSVNYNTSALTDIAEIVSSGPVALDTTHLVDGENTLAVEVHRAAGGQNAFFAAALTAVETPIAETPLPSLSFTEIGPASTTPFQVEIHNDGDASVELEGLILACKGTVTDEFVLPAITLSSGQYGAFDETSLGFHPADGDKLFLYVADRSAVVDAAVVKSSLRAKTADGSRWAIPDAASFGSANSFAFHDEIVINEIMYHDRPVPESQAEYETSVLIPSFVPAITLVPTNGNLGLTWTGGNEPFDDSAWIQGTGKTTGVGYETTPENYQTLIKTSVLSQMYGNNGNASVYIRIPFHLADPTTVESLILLMKFDDGFVAYLNGEEVAHYYAPGRDGNTDPLTWESHSTNSYSDSEALVFRTFDITDKKSYLKAGRNILAIHGLNWSTGSTDMLILPELHARRQIQPYIPFHESPQEWIELYNKSDHAIDLGGWKLRGGVEYDFPDATIVEPDHYLVVTSQSQSLHALYPDIEILGDFSGQLSDKGDRVTLLDPTGNLADEVHYYDRGYWPAYADAGGSSLELTDPRADNSVASAWAAGDEASRSEWKTYSYRAVASPTSGGNEPSQWNELILGLLDSGEFLIDDIRVVEDPDGAALSLIQNGFFQDGMNTWRALGNHAFCEVVSDPDNTSNPVLHVRATGPSEHMHNHIETTFVSNHAVVNGKTYEISYRAKWLGGSNLLNTRLYFNRCPKTTSLVVPSIVGTPGQQNSRFVENAGPTIQDLRHAPSVPAADEPIVISVRADDPDGVATLTLFWSQNGGAFQTSPMTLKSSGRYQASIGPLPAGTLVQFYVQGRDSLSATTTWPAGGADSRCLCKVDDGLARAGTHPFRILMTAADAAFLHETTNIMSNHRAGATVIDGENRVYYDVGLHLKGSGYGRGDSRAGFNLRFQPDNLFRGIHEGVSIDRGAGPYGVGASHRELIVKHIGNRAGGIPGMYDDIIYLLPPRSDMSGTAQLMMARYDDEYLDSQYADGAEGTLYEFELIYHSQSTVDGNPESLKLPPSSVLQIDLWDLGDDKEGYRWNYLIKNNRAADDFTSMMSMAKAYSLSGTAFSDRIDSEIDADEWMRVFAFESLTGIGDTYNQGLNHNIMFYVRPEDRRVLAMPWDLDFSFSQSTTASIFGGGSSVQKVIALDPWKRSFYGHLYDIIQTCFNTEYLTDWMQPYAAASGQDYTADLLSIIDQRRSFVLSQLPAQIPFAITTNNGNPFSVDTDSVTLTGAGWINIHRMNLAGFAEPLTLSWTGLSAWSVTIPVEFGDNILNLEARDFHGNLVATDSITVTCTSQNRPLRQFLRVTELMYDPLGGKDYEFVEFRNTGPDPLDLSQAAISGGIQFAFAGGTVQSLQPGAFVVVARNLSTFRSRYGTAVPVVGPFSGSLSNSGDILQIRGALGSEVLSFAYDNSRGWPLAPQAGGHSLVPRESAVAGEADGSLEYGGNWRCSAYIHGSPGSVDPLLPAGVVVNEVMAHTDYASPPYDSNDWIELYNAGDSAVDLGAGWYLSDNVEQLKKWSLPTVHLKPGDRVVFDEITGFHNPITAGFGLNKAGEQVVLSYLPGNGQDRIVDSVRFKGQENFISLGRLPDGADAWYRLQPSRNLPNTEPVADIVVGEFAYNPQGVAAEGEYIELYNPTDSPVVMTNIAGQWRLNDSVSFTFPVGTAIQPHGRLLVVGFDPAGCPSCLAAFQSRYNAPTLVPGVDIVGPWQGTLPDTVGVISLERPQAPDVVGDEVSWVLVDEVIYCSRSPWSSLCADGSQVLQRRPELLDGNDPAAWYPAPPTPGRRGIAQSDFNTDALVDLSDLAIFSAAWLTETGEENWNATCEISISPDGIIDFRDLAQFTDQWLWHLNPRP
ncbi:MAG: hypothetical protein GX455_02270 [Phycisphaerae bacterium]|nr:hypothetical protein [Phycisphaerae bacterium]